MSFNNGFNDGFNNGFNNNERFAMHLRHFIGEVVTVFTASGGISGSGFTGVLLTVNCDFIRLVTEQGSAPTSPLEPIFDECDNGNMSGNFNGQNFDHRRCQCIGTETDIPIDKIVAFVHNEK